MSTHQVDYSIVVPVYYNSETIESTFNSILNEVVSRRPDLTPEVVFVDDGSGDDSLKILLDLHSRHPQMLQVVSLTRNFGQLGAILAGLSTAQGRCAITMSADGQDRAALINEMLEAHFTSGFEIVACARVGRDESAFRILTSRFFYGIIKRLSFPNMPIGGFDYVLLGRRAITVILRNREAHGFFQGQILWTGYKIKFLQYFRESRKGGTSRWTMAKRITYLIDGVMSYSYWPIRGISIAGLVFALFGFCYALIVFITRLTWGVPVKGWAPLIIIILTMGGMQMIMLGIIGEYLWRALAQVRNRDPYIVDFIRQRAL